MEISRKEYCQLYLDYYQRGVGVTDWFAFLDSDNRLHTLMKAAVIERPRGRPADSFRDNDGLLWFDLFRLIDGNWFGLWPNPTPFELWVASHVEDLNDAWISNRCYKDSQGVIAKQIEDRYNYLLQLSASHWRPDNIT